MLTYNKDIYKKILEPLGIKYLISENSEYYKVPSNRQMVWEFLFPKKIRDRIALNESSFSALNMGKGDKKNSTDAARDRFKQVLLYSNSEYYGYMSEHLNYILENGVAVEMWLAEHKKTIKQVNLKLGSIEEFRKTHSDTIKEKKRKVIKKLVGLLEFLKNDVISDVRFSEGFWEKAYDMAETDPVLLLEIVCLASIFSCDDSDYDFWDTIENHYINVIEQKTEERVVDELVCFKDEENINVSDVFEILEVERKRVERKNVNKCENIKTTKVTEAIEKCEEHVSHLRSIVDQMEEKNDTI